MNKGRFQCSIGASIVVLVLLGNVLSQSGHQGLEPRFAELSRDDTVRLDKQRAVVAAAARRYGAGDLTKTKADLVVLQKLIDHGAFKQSETYELQCLGIVFGDVLASELPLRWVMVTDEYGTDPTSRFKKTTIQINALTMISKRIERNEPVDVTQLLQLTREQLAQVEHQLH